MFSRLMKFVAVVGACCSLLISSAGLATAAQTAVEVTLFDAGSAVSMPEQLGMAMTGAAKATMHVLAAPRQIRAGAVTFKVKNNSKEFVHEMLVVRVAD